MGSTSKHDVKNMGIMGIYVFAANYTMSHAFQ